jgi:oligopeptide transport system permease protein
MLRTLLSRLTQTIVVVFCLVSFTFVAVRLIPGNPFVGEKALAEHEQAALEEAFGLDKPASVQFVLYWKNILTKGDFGISTSLKGRKVSEIMKQAFPVSLLVGSTALVIAIFTGIPLGIIAALRKNGIIDYLSMIIAMAGICIPAFVLGPLLQLLVARNLTSINVGGWERPSDLLLPAFTLSVGVAAYLARLTRGGMLEVLHQDFIRTARAKGVGAFTLVTRHALRPALMPAVTYLGPAFAAIITGSFVVETIFGVPGMGQHFVTAITANDPYLIQGLVTFYGILMGTANLLVDFTLAAMNPRLRENV